MVSISFKAARLYRITREINHFDQIAIACWQARRLTEPQQKAPVHGRETGFFSKIQP